MTKADALLWLAERFPTLQRECEYCDGRGWIVAEVYVERIVEIALHLQGVASVMFTFTDDGLTACYIWGKTSPHEPVGHAKAKTNVGAACLALVAAVKAQEETNGD